MCRAVGAIREVSGAPQALLDCDRTVRSEGREAAQSVQQSKLHSRRSLGLYVDILSK